MSDTELLQAVHAALARDPRLRSNKRELRIRLADDVVVLDGTVNSIAAKRLIPRKVFEVSGLGALDRLRLRPEEQRADPDLASDVERVLAEDAAFADYRIKAARIVDHEPVIERLVCVDVTDGVIRLSGTVESLSCRRLAEVLAWWVPGRRDVENRLYVSPAEMDSDAGITNALRLVLERDAKVDADRVAIRTRDRIVTLKGTIPQVEQKQSAEDDAWYLAGVHDVDNRIRVRDHEKLQECADEASRESFPASDPPSMTPVIGVGGAR